MATETCFVTGGIEQRVKTMPKANPTLNVASKARTIFVLRYRVFDLDIKLKFSA